MGLDGLLIMIHNKWAQVNDMVPDRVDPNHGTSLE